MFQSLPGSTRSSISPGSSSVFLRFSSPRHTSPCLRKSASAKTALFSLASSLTAFFFGRWSVWPCIGCLPGTSRQSDLLPEAHAAARWHTPHPSMRSRTLIGITALAVGGITLAVWLARRGEPSYQGKPLSAWLRSLDKSPMSFEFQSDGPGGVVTNHPAAQAFLHMGSNAVPWLIEELKVRDPAIKIWFRQLLTKQHFVHINLTPDYVRHRRALEACWAIGPACRAAIPDMSRLLNEHELDITTRTWSLAGTGPDALVPMISALTNSDPEVGVYAAEAFRHVAFDAQAAVPALVTCLSDPQDDRVRCAAALALASIHKRPDIVVPALTKNLNDPNQTVRDLTATALRRFQDASQGTH